MTSENELIKPKKTLGRPLEAEQSLEVGFSINKHVSWNLSLWKNAVLKQDMDLAIFIDGKEGGGKSVHAQQIATFLDVDGKITLDQICFTPDAVRDQITKLKKGKAIIYDEAQRGFNRRNSMSNDNIMLMNLLAECRQNNLFLIIIMPSFYNADMGVAVFRSRLLINIRYSWDLDKPELPLVRGQARFYSERGKKVLYCNTFNRKFFNYPYLKDDCFDYTFPHHYCVDEVAYRLKKRQAVNDYKALEEKKSFKSSDKEEKGVFSLPKNDSVDELLDILTPKKGTLVLNAQEWYNDVRSGVHK